MPHGKATMPSASGPRWVYRTEFDIISAPRATYQQWAVFGPNTGLYGGLKVASHWLGSSHVDAVLSCQRDSADMLVSRLLLGFCWDIPYIWYEPMNRNWGFEYGFGMNLHVNMLLTLIPRFGRLKYNHNFKVGKQPFCVDIEAYPGCRSSSPTTAKINNKRASGMVNLRSRPHKESVSSYHRIHISHHRPCLWKKEKEKEGKRHQMKKLAPRIWLT